MTSAGFETALPAVELLWIYAFDRAATGIDALLLNVSIVWGINLSDNLKLLPVFKHLFVVAEHFFLILVNCYAAVNLNY